MTDSLHTAIRNMLREANNIVVTAHIRPDGDAIGSVLGLGLAIQETGKNVQMVLKDGISGSFRFLAGSELVRTSVSGEVDCYIVVDCSDLERAGDVLPGRKPDLVIDHHITNLRFGKLNLVEPETVATTALLAKYMEAWGLKISVPVAEALTTGLITDTLGFRTSNMNPEALRIAADLMEKGANLPELYMKAMFQRSFEAVQFWGTGLVNIQRSERIIWTTLTAADRKQVGYPGKDDADLINVLSTVRDADVALIFVESDNQHIKVSWRAKPGLDISGIALQFGGGGHPAASGASIPGAMEEVQQKVLDATQAYLDQQQ